MNMSRNGDVSLANKESRNRHRSRLDSRGYSVNNIRRDTRDTSYARGSRNNSRRGREENPFQRATNEKRGTQIPADMSDDRAQLANLGGRSVRPTNYEFPTNPSGSFAQAMSSIACNAEAGAKGVFNSISQDNDSFKEHVSQALAIKLNLKTTQQANEKVLLSLLKSEGKNSGLKQTLQARAAVYGSLLDPA